MKGFILPMRVSFREREWRKVRMAQTARSRVCSENSRSRGLLRPALQVLEMSSKRSTTELISIVFPHSVPARKRFIEF